MRAIIVAGVMALGAGSAVDAATLEYRGFINTFDAKGTDLRADNYYFEYYGYEIGAEIGFRVDLDLSSVANLNLSGFVDYFGEVGGDGDLISNYDFSGNLRGSMPTKFISDLRYTLITDSSGSLVSASIIASQQNDTEVLATPDGLSVTLRAFTPKPTPGFFGDGAFTFSYSPELAPDVAAIPIPATMPLLVLALGGMASVGRRHRRPR